MSTRTISAERILSESERVLNNGNIVQALEIVWAVKNWPNRSQPLTVKEFIKEVNNG